MSPRKDGHAVAERKSAPLICVTDHGTFGHGTGLFCRYRRATLICVAHRLPWWVCAKWHTDEYAMPVRSRVKLLRHE